MLAFGLTRRSLWMPVVQSIAWLHSGVVSADVRAQLEPLPVEESVLPYEHVRRPPINLSADGEWIAHTYTAHQPAPFEEGTVGFGYSPTGVPYITGKVPHARLTRVATGQIIELGDPERSSWAPVWSPDGKLVAFYSDADGEAGLWIWERDTARAARFPGVIVRSRFGFEAVRWSADSKRMLVKVLPEGITVAQANLRINWREQPLESATTRNKSAPSVVVHRFPATESTGAPSASGLQPYGISEDLADLAILDMDSRTVLRVARNTAASWYAFSPDGQSLAYVHSRGRDPLGLWSIRDLVHVNLRTGESRTLVEKLPFMYGTAVNWSPDSRYLAYVTAGPKTAGDCFLVSVTDGAVRKLGGDGTPSFAENVVRGDDLPPLWSATGKSVLAVGAGKLWRLDRSAGEPSRAYEIPTQMITGIVSRSQTGVAWSGDHASVVWVTTRGKGELAGGIWRIDLSTGAVRAIVKDQKLYLNLPHDLDASDHARRIAFVAEDMCHPREIWTLDISTRQVKRATGLSQIYDRYALGTVRLIEWKTAEGESLRGALLLPPGYKEAVRYPLVVFAYGGSNTLGEASPTQAKDLFALGFGAGAFNFHVLATRGYAVLYPEAPQRVGSPARDLVRTIIPAVDKAIALGIADPDRIAAMGQSYGSYSVLVLITQTQRFRAAVISAVSLHPDLISSYLANPSGMTLIEKGQGKMGGSLWEFPQRYLENSPVFAFDKIEAPLLIAHGTRDNTATGDALDAPTAVFNALQRLQKPVELRVYEGEGHAIMGKANVIDFWNRRLEFLAEHLDIALDSKGAIRFQNGKAASRRLSN